MAYPYLFQKSHISMSTSRWLKTKIDKENDRKSVLLPQESERIFFIFEIITWDTGFSVVKVSIKDSRPVIRDTMRN